MTAQPASRRPRRMSSSILALLLLLVPTLRYAVGGVPGTQAAPILPPGFYEETVVSATPYQTTAFAFLPDGRILINEKSGVVRVQKNGVLLPTPLLDIRDRINQYEDRGLLGIAIDPAFATGSPYIYLSYTYEHIRDADWTNDNARKTARVSRFTVAGDVADPGSEQIVLGRVTPASGSCNSAPLADCLPSDGSSHSIGNLKFAPDGSLFVNIGDGADYNQVDDDALRAQDLDSLAGKVLRVNKDGTGWVGNPFYSTPTDNRSKVWAYGIRNAFRFNLRPGTALPYLGDVGWGEWEEINIANRGANLGWPCYEGDDPQPGYAPKATCVALYNGGPAAVQRPLVAWSHNNASAAATGGAFYTGTGYPAAYRGAYFYGDYAQGVLRSLRVDANNALIPGSVADFATSVEGPVDIEIGPEGELYYVSIVTGQIHRLRYGTPPPPPPVTTGFLSDQPWVTASNGFGPVERDRSNGESGAADGNPLRIGGVSYAKGLGVHAPASITYALGSGCDIFSAQLGIDDEVQTNGGSVVFQVWSGDTKLYESRVLTGADPAETIAVSLAGRTELRLVVTDGGDTPSSDHADWANAQCGPNRPPVATIDAPTIATYRIGDRIAYAGTATDPDESTPPTLVWQLITRHCPGGACHAHPSELAGARGFFVINDHDDETHLELLLTATDSGGLKTTKSARLDPQQAPLTLNTAPVGLNVVYGSKPAAPTVLRQIDVGGKRTITAPSPQTLDGASYRFSRWSDGDTNAQRIVTIAEGGATYTAIFTPVAAPPPSPSPAPNPSPAPGQPTLTVGLAGAGTGTVTRGDAGTVVTLTPRPDAGSVFTGWTIDGRPVGWANPLTITRDADRTIVATFAPRQAFGDATPNLTGSTEAIAQLAARGIIKGCDPAAGRFCPADTTLRAQMAALIVRALGWGGEHPANPFTDRDGVDDELWNAVATLAAHGVAKGYGDGTYGTTGPVLNAQVISFITRAMVDKGYWAFQTDDGSIYPNVGADSGHRRDLVTYVHYVGPVRGATDPLGPFAGWEAPATRAWFAFVFWQALDEHFGADRLGAGGYIP